MRPELSTLIAQHEVPLMAAPKHFISIHYRICKHFETQIEAYEALEKYYQLHFKRRKYSSYESFKTIRQRMIRTKSI